MKEKLAAYMCVNDYFMDDGDKAFIRGKLYYFNNRFITESEIGKNHIMEEEDNFDTFFMLESDMEDKSKKELSELLNTNDYAKEEYEEAIKKAIDYGIKSKEAEKYWKEKFKIK